MIERKMGYRGSKSITDIINPTSQKSVIVKEQRVDGSYIKNKNLMLRCTLMGCESSYQVKILSNQIIPIRQYSTTPKSIDIVTSKAAKLDPWTVTGFTDAEGCFSLRIRRRSKNLRWYSEVRYIISLHKKDFNTLERIKAYFGGVGNIMIHGKDSVQYVVASLDQINTKIVPHFESYELKTQKFADYLLFKMAIDIIKNKEHLEQDLCSGLQSKARGG